MPVLSAVLMKGARLLHEFSCTHESDFLIWAGAFCLPTKAASRWLRLALFTQNETRPPVQELVLMNPISDLWRARSADPAGEDKPPTSETAWAFPDETCLLHKRALMKFTELLIQLLSDNDPYSLLSETWRANR